MVQFDTPAVVAPDPQANITDLLVERVKKTPQLALFAVPEGTGWRDITASDFLNQVVALAKGLVAAGIEPGGSRGMLHSQQFRGVRRREGVLSACGEGLTGTGGKLGAYASAALCTGSTGLLHRARIASSCPKRCGPCT